MGEKGSEVGRINDGESGKEPGEGDSCEEVGDWDFVVEGEVFGRRGTLGVLNVGICTQMMDRHECVLRHEGTRSERMEQTV